MVAPRPLTIDGDAPQYVRRLVADLEKAYVKAYPTAPVRLPSFTSTDLPKASDYAWCLIAVIDKACAAISDGSQWLRVDGSAL